MELGSRSDKSSGICNTREHFTVERYRRALEELREEQKLLTQLYVHDARGRQQIRCDAQFLALSPSLTGANNGFCFFSRAPISDCLSSRSEMSCLVHTLPRHILVHTSQGSYN